MQDLIHLGGGRVKGGNCHRRIFCVPLEVIIRVRQAKLH